MLRVFFLPNNRLSQSAGTHVSVVSGRRERCLTVVTDPAGRTAHHFQRQVLVTPVRDSVPHSKLDLTNHCWPRILSKQSHDGAYRETRFNLNVKTADEKGSSSAEWLGPT